MASLMIVKIVICAVILLPTPLDPNGVGVRGRVDKAPAY